MRKDFCDSRVNGVQLVEKSHRTGKKTKRGKRKKKEKRRESELLNLG